MSPSLADPKTALQGDAKLTIREVARLANVSRAAVTRAFQPGKAAIKPETKQRILSIADEVGYRPNLIAQRLKSHSPRAICLPNIVDELTLKTGVGAISFGLGNLIAGAASILTPAGYDLEPIFFASDEDANKRLAMLYRAGYFNGLLLPVRSIPSRGVLKVLDRMGCPMFGTAKEYAELKNYHFVPESISTPGIDSVAISLLKSGRRVFADCHCKLDFKRLAAIAGVNPADVRSVNVAESLVDRRGCTPGNWRKLLNREPGLDAVITNDEAGGWRVFKALNALGVRVPEEVTISGAADVRHILKPLPVQALRHSPGSFRCRMLARRAVSVLSGIEETGMERDMKALAVDIVFELSPEEFRQAAAVELRLDRVRTEACGKLAPES